MFLFRRQVLIWSNRRCYRLKCVYVCVCARRTYSYTVHLTVTARLPYARNSRNTYVFLPSDRPRPRSYAFLKAYCSITVVTYCRRHRHHRFHRPGNIPVTYYYGQIFIIAIRCTFFIVLFRGISPYYYYLYYCCTIKINPL